MALGDAGDGVEAPEAIEHSDAVNESLWSFVSLMFSPLYFLLENSQLYTLKQKELGHWLEMSKCQLEGGKLLIGLWEVPRKGIEALSVRRSGGSTPEGVEIDETGRLWFRRGNLKLLPVFMNRCNRSQCFSLKLHQSARGLENRNSRILSAVLDSQIRNSVKYRCLPLHMQRRWTRKRRVQLLKMRMGVQLS